MYFRLTERDRRLRGDAMALSLTWQHPLAISWNVWNSNLHRIPWPSVCVLRTYLYGQRSSDSTGTRKNLTFMWQRPKFEFTTPCVTRQSISVFYFTCFYGRGNLSLLIWSKYSTCIYIYNLLWTMKVTRSFPVSLFLSPSVCLYPFALGGHLIFISCIWYSFDLYLICSATKPHWWSSSS